MAPSGASSAKPRSTAITAPPPTRGRSAAAIVPTCVRPTVPSSSRDRTSPASMSTQRRPPHRPDQTGPSPWYATDPVICSARTGSAGAGEAVVVVLAGLVLERGLLGLG